jgi:hypothetical protein
VEAALETRLRAALSKHEIRDVLLRYCRGVDRRDAELLLTVFHEDAVLDRGNSTRSAAEFIEFIASSPATQMMHSVGNVWIELEGDTALSEAYFVSTQILDTTTRAVPDNGGSSWVESAPGLSIVTSAGRYLDRFERQDGTWKISYRAIVHEWGRMEPFVTSPDREGEYRAARSRSDPSYAFFADGSLRLPDLQLDDTEGT